MVAKVNISEIFFSVQGEGPWIGVPSTFLRLAGCNLKCKWCDTKYAKKGTKMTVEEVQEKIEEVSKGCNYLTVTGGEPTLQSEELVDVLKWFYAKDRRICVETNCTGFPLNLLNLVHLWAVSPKLKSSGEKYNAWVMDRFSSLETKRVIFKFVVGGAEDYQQFLELLPKFKNREIVLQPDGMVPSLEEYRKRLQFLHNWVLESYDQLQENGVLIRILPQLQRLTWGQRRGI